ncbi:PAS domain-containing sensor histidine kinase [Litoreibacter janthinus]|uniref:histidine kinase n=1 Tax=Litoreibacter janthinus TaxID=670154 RepID=A0A1I6FRU6_9RHOB|nr:PAS domain S-box protein [Litoreibacter janthinus]SFR32643.1 PAS domain S-box-containing protein [Litoreibacter janthinus]
MTKRSEALDLSIIQPVIDALHDSVAILTQDGSIVGVNRSWMRFSKENNGDQTTGYVGANYLQICQESNGTGSEFVSSIKEGLVKVLSGGSEFQAEYPCHSETERRWFEVVASSFKLNGARLALVAHRNITSKKLALVEADNAEQHALNLAAIVTTMPDAVIAFDLEGRITSWNAAATNLYGYEREEILGQSMEMLYPPDWPKRVKDYITEIVNSELKYFDAIRLTKSGEQLTIAITAAPIRSSTGEVIGISNVHRDVTSEREAEHRLRSILNNLFAFVGILDLDGTLLEANRAPLEVAGLKPKDVIGKKFWDCYWWNYSPDVAQKIRNACEQVRDGDIARFDVEVQVADGQLIWIDFQMAPLLSQTGVVENLIPSGIDISERKAIHAALMSSHDTFQNLVNRSPFGIFTLDADFRFAHVSVGALPAFGGIRPLIGRDYEETMRALWPEDFADEIVGRFRHTLATGEAYDAPSTVGTRKDSDEIASYDWMIERITMPDGRFGVVCNFYDLSERQKYEEHVRLLMSEVNHRSKNLLAVVLSMARQTARTSSPTDFVERFSQRLLGLSSCQNLIVDGSWEGVGVKELARSQLSHLGEEIQSNRVRIEGPDLIVTPSAAEGIGMALHELSTNALKYGALSGPVGNVQIVWSIEEGGQLFRMQWSEHDGPTVTEPKRTGFGTTVTERMAANAVGGKVELKYEPFGVVWVLTAPMEEVQMGEAA